jgi:RimJ/RimL family protein N-acetyltransferase
VSTPAVATRRANGGDWPLVDAFHQRCSPESLRRRWGRAGIRRDDWDQLLAGATCWITTTAETGEVIALTCLGPVPRQPGVMDLGLQVADAWHRSGLGSALAYRAACQARALGAHTLTAYTQASNTAMLAVLRRLGPAQEHRDGSHFDVRVALRELSPPPVRPPALLPL